MSASVVLLCEDLQTDMFLRRRFGRRFRRQLRQEADCEPLADVLYDLCHRRQKLQEPAPRSLVEACREYPRLTRLLQR